MSWIRLPNIAILWTSILVGLFGFSICRFGLDLPAQTRRPVMTDTTAVSYWLNWRFLVCGLWVLGCMVLSAFFIWKYEGGRSSSPDGDNQQGAGMLCKDEVWTTCLAGIHPAWLLAFRIFAFVLLLALIIGNTVVDGGGIFIYYTQCTFALVTIYFGVASAFSIYGLWQHRDRFIQRLGNRTLHAEGGSYVVPTYEDSENAPLISNFFDHQEDDLTFLTAGFFSYVMQIMYQVSAGAVVLTDVVFWLVIYPFLTSVDFKLNFYLVSMHSANVVLLIDTILNCMRFPWFRFAYFILWTALYVIYQWILHACINLEWPYPFLDLSSPFAPLWYVAVALLHILSYGIVILIVGVKQHWLSREIIPRNLNRCFR